MRASTRPRRSNYRMRVSDGLDRLLFIVVFLAGVAGIWGAKLLGVSQWIVTIAIVALMSAYVLICWRAARAQLREDVLADNAYYLGFLFTLASLGAALYQAQATEGGGARLIETLLGDFGIALASTIAGVFFRVLIGQFRRDPAEFERAARIELVDASARMRSQLNQSAEAFNDFRGQMTQLAREGMELSLTRHDEALKGQLALLDTTMRDIARTIDEDLAAPIREGANALRQATDDFARQAEALSALTRRSGARIEASVDDLNAAMEEAAAKAMAVAEKRAVASQADPAAQSSKDQRDSIRALSSAAMDSAAERAAAKPEALTGARKEAPKLVADGGRAAFREDLTALRADLHQLTLAVEGLQGGGRPAPDERGRPWLTLGRRNA